MSYVADMNVLMTYLKCMDDWNDERKVFRFLYAKVLGHHSKELRTGYRKKIKRMVRLMREMAEEESTGDAELDVMANHFGMVMSEVFTYREDMWTNEMRHLGFLLGKYVYVLDAYDDFEKDRKSGSFNALRMIIEREEDAETYVHNCLINYAAEAARCFERLPLVNNIEIMRNILYAGMWSAFYKKQKR